MCVCLMYDVKKANSMTHFANFKHILALKLHLLCVCVWVCVCVGG